MKRYFSIRTIVPVFLAALLVIPASLFAKSFFEKLVKEPEIKVKEILLQRISTRDAAFLTVLEIENRTPVRAELSGVDYDFKLSGTRLAKGETGSGVSVKPYDDARFEIPVEVTYENLKAIYDSARGKDRLPYRLEGEVRVKTPWGDLPVPYKAKGKLPVVRPSKIRRVKAELKSLSLQQASLDLKIELENPNVFELDIPRLQYDLDLKDKNFASGTMQNQRVKKKSAGEIIVPVNLDLTGTSQWIREVLQGGATDYRLQYDATYRIKGHEVHQKETVSGSLKF